MANYCVKSSDHNYALINVAWDADCIVVRAFDEYFGEVDQNRVINSTDITSDTNMYPFESLFQYNSKWYFLQSSFKMRRDYGQLQGSGTYLIYTMHSKMNLYAMRLDAEKYPDLIVNDWRWIENRGYGAVLKFCLHKDGQSFDNVPKVYYLRGPEANSTIFLTKDTISGQPTTDGKTQVIPTFTYQVTNGKLVVTSDDTNVGGLIHIEHKKNVIVDDVVTVDNGYAELPISVVDTSRGYSFDVLYGFTKVTTIAG